MGPNSPAIQLNAELVARRRAEGRDGIPAVFCTASPTDPRIRTDHEVRHLGVIPAA
jgi:hypothetical protein